MNSFRTTPQTKNLRCKPISLLWLFVVVVSLQAAGQDALEDDSAAAAALERSQELNARQQALEEMQSEFGIYSPVLIEQYSDLADYFRDAGDQVEAIRFYNSALQVARIANGLYSQEQLPVLQRMIESNIELKDWEEADKLEHLKYHISSRLYAVDDDDFLLAATKYGDWKLRVVRENLLALSGRSLTNETEDLSEFYTRIITDLETKTDASQEDLLQMIYGKSLADMALARAVASTPYTYFQGTVSQYISETRCQNVVNSQGALVRQCYNVQVENPRYRQSQVDAKQMAVSQYARQVDRSIEKLQAIASSSVNLTDEQRLALESHIGELQTESILIQRSARRRSLF